MKRFEPRTRPVREHGVRPALAAAALIALAVPGLLRGQEWSTFHGDAGLTGAADAGVPGKPARLWRARLGSPVSRAPVGDRQGVYVVTDDSEIVALDPSGLRRWAVRPALPSATTGAVSRARIDAPLLLVDGRLIVGSAEGRVFCFDAASGRTNWTYDAGAPVQGSLTWGTATNGAVRLFAVTQPDGVLHALDAATGRQLWVTPATGRTDGHPSAAGGRIAFGNCNAAFYVFAQADGADLGSVALGPDSQVAGGVALAGDLAWAGSRGGVLYAVDLAASRVAWTNQLTDGELFTTPCVDAKRVVVSAGDGAVFGLDRATGTRVWMHRCAAQSPTDPVLAGGTVAFGDGGKLVLLDAATGEERWSVAVSDAISAPAVIDGRLVVGADDGTVTAFGAPPAAPGGRVEP